MGYHQKHPYLSQIFYILKWKVVNNRLAAEKNFENKVKDFLKEEGCWFIKYWGGAAYTKSGIPDILVCCNGKFLGVEVKAPNGKPSPLQIHNLKLIDEAGGHGVLLYPNQFEDFKNLVHGIKTFNTALVDESYQDLKERWWKYADVT